MGRDPNSRSESRGAARPRPCTRLLDEEAERVRRVYAEKDYLDAYSEHTDLRVAKDPHTAVGGMWDRLGTLQFEYLRDAGLAHHHSLLDIGCGTLRAGRHFIRYLDANRYTGIDISPAAIAYARELVRRESLEEKSPRLVLCNEKALNFSELRGQTVDYILAHSVFTHLPPQQIDKCFAHIGTIMEAWTQFFFTYSRADEHMRDGFKNFSYPEDIFHKLARRHSLVVREPRYSYEHPRHQRMLLVTRAPSDAQSGNRCYGER